MSPSLAKTTLIGSWFNDKVIGYSSINSEQNNIIEFKFYLGIDIYIINDISSGAVEIVFKYMNDEGNIDSENFLAYYDKCKKKFVFNTNSQTNIIFKDIDVDVDVEFFYNGELRINSNGDLDIKMNINTLNSDIKGTINDTLKKEHICF